jgi:hypothetical protein
MSASIPKKQKISVEEIITNLPRQEQVIVKKLRSLVLECLPSATEKNTYGAPFYSHYRMICFIWPPSLYWGGKNKSLKDRGVTLGFCQGNLMANEDGILLAEGRKQMYCLYFKSPGEIDEVLIRALLFEAELIDRSFFKKKSKSGRT